jgi:hypothetical protein
VTALRLSKLVDPSPLLKAVPEAAAKRRSKPLMVLVPTTTRRFNASVTLATTTSAANKSATAVTSQSSAPAQTVTAAVMVAAASIATVKAATTARRIHVIVTISAIHMTVTMKANAITVHTIHLKMRIIAPTSQIKRSESQEEKPKPPQELHTKAGRARETNQKKSAMNQSKDINDEGECDDVTKRKSKWYVMTISNTTSAKFPKAHDKMKENHKHFRFYDH